MSILRFFFGPRLTEKERNTTWFGIRPLADPDSVRQCLGAGITFASSSKVPCTSMLALIAFVLAPFSLGMPTSLRDAFFISWFCLVRNVPALVVFTRFVRKNCAHASIDKFSLELRCSLLVYATIAPLVTYFLSVFFLLLNVSYRHQFVYIYPTFPDSGGRLWSNLFLGKSCGMGANPQILRCF